MSLQCRVLIGPYLTYMRLRAGCERDVSVCGHPSRPVRGQRWWRHRHAYLAQEMVHRRSSWARPRSHPLNIFVFIFVWTAISIFPPSLSLPSIFTSPIR